MPAPPPGRRGARGPDRRRATGSDPGGSLSSPTTRATGGQSRGVGSRVGEAAHKVGWSSKRRRGIPTPHSLHSGRSRWPNAVHSRCWMRECVGRLRTRGTGSSARGEENSRVGTMGNIVTPTNGRRAARAAMWQACAPRPEPTTTSESSAACRVCRAQSPRWRRAIPKVGSPCPFDVARAARRSPARGYAASPRSRARPAPSASSNRVTWSPCACIRAASAMRGALSPSLP